MMLFSEFNIVSISISFVVLAFIREANCNDFLKSLFTLNKPFFTAIDISRQSLSPALTVTRTLVSGCKKPSIGITYSFRPRLKASSSSLALAVRHEALAAKIEMHTEINDKTIAIKSCSNFLLRVLGLDFCLTAQILPSTPETNFVRMR